MNRYKTGGPVFPVSHDMALVAGLQNAYGITLRDFFAAKAMQGIMANQDDDWGDHFAIAEIAYSMADAMLEAREA